MPKKRSSQAGSNSATAKLISRINKFGQNVINNSSSFGSFDQVTNELSPRQANHYYDDDDEVFVLTAKQKQQLQRNEYLESLTKEQLKIEAKRRGQKTAGTKTELVLFDVFASNTRKSPCKVDFSFAPYLILEIGTEHFFSCFLVVSFVAIFRNFCAICLFNNSGLNEEFLR
jgi:hypothetical protein